MKTFTPTLEEMTKRVARFADLEPYGQQFAADNGIPEAAFQQLTANKVYPVMVPSTYEGRSARAPIKSVPGAIVTIAECPPQNGPGLHCHEQTVENFFCLNGEFDIIWGDNEENSLRLKPLDMVSVPPGVNRRFFNRSDETARLLVIIQPASAEQKDRVAYAPHVASKLVDDFGVGVVDKLKGIGFKFDAGQSE